MNDVSQPEPGEVARVTGLDVRAMVVEALAGAEAELRERVLSLEADVDAYRELAQQALHALYDLTLERDHLRTHNRRLQEENRELLELARAVA